MSRAFNAVFLSLIITSIVACDLDEETAGIEDACDDFIEVVVECMPEINQSVCGASDDCSAYIHDDADERCEDAAEQNNLSEEDIEEAVSEMESMGCDELAVLVGYYIETESSYAIDPLLILNGALQSGTIY